MRTGPRQLRKQFGATLRELRIRHGWTQEYLVTRLQHAGFDRCKRSLLSQLEVGAASIRGEEIYFLRAVFGDEFERDFWNPYYNRRINEIREEDIS